MLAPIERVLPDQPLRLGHSICAPSHRHMVVLHTSQVLRRRCKASGRLHFTHQVSDLVLLALLLHELLRPGRASETLLVLLLIEEVPSHDFADRPEGFKNLKPRVIAVHCDWSVRFLD